MRKPVARVSDPNQAVQPQEMARGSKFRISMYILVLFFIIHSGLSVIGGGAVA